jgi:hypothetical protein
MQIGVGAIFQPTDADKTHLWLFHLFLSKLYFGQETNAPNRNMNNTNRIGVAI